MRELKLIGIVKEYEDFLLNVNFEVFGEELVSILGPSGSGKTTVLNIIAGFIFPDKGSMTKDGDDITNMPAEKRNIGVVFQDYALFPFLNVYNNIAFGLKVRKFTSFEIGKKIQEISEKLEITGILKKFPDNISGGEKQRVAIARALVTDPDILLLDEPLSNLDAKIREKLVKEIRNLHKIFRKTIIYVTHDQEEAMFLSDRIVVLNNGLIEQTGTPFDIYELPKTPFVRDFIGKGSYITIDGIKRFVRPEDIVINKNGPYEGTIEDFVFLGGFIELSIQSQIGKLSISERSKDAKNYKIGSKIKFAIKEEKWQ